MKMKIITLLTFSTLLLFACDEEIETITEVKLTKSQCTQDDREKNIIALQIANDILFGNKVVTVNQRNKKNQLNNILETLYGDQWLKVYIQHDRDFNELVKRVNVVLYDKEELTCIDGKLVQPGS